MRHIRPITAHRDNLEHWGVICSFKTLKPDEARLVRATARAIAHGDMEQPVRVRLTDTEVNVSLIPDTTIPHITR